MVCVPGRRAWKRVGAFLRYNWTCGCCGAAFDTLPLDYACRLPDPWFGVPDAERDERCKATADFCKVDEHYFVRGCIEIPVLGLNDTFAWGVWASLSETSFKRVLELWNKPLPEGEGPYFGWLCNWLSGYPEPHEVKCHIHLRPGDRRPAIVLEPTDYPLAVEQRTGITVERVMEIAAGAGLHAVPPA